MEKQLILFISISNPLIFLGLVDTFWRKHPWGVTSFGKETLLLNPARNWDKEGFIIAAVDNNSAGYYIYRG